MSDEIPPPDPRLEGLIRIGKTGSSSDDAVSGPVQQTALPFVLWDDLDNDVAKTWLVDRLLGAGEFSAWYGPPGSGKSVGVEDVTIHVAAGRAWFGRNTMKGAVLYIALERAELVKRRAVAFRKKHGIKESLPFAVMRSVLDFREKSTADCIIQAAAQCCLHQNAEPSRPFGEPATLLLPARSSRLGER